MEPTEAEKGKHTAIGCAIMLALAVAIYFWIATRTPDPRFTEMPGQGNFSFVIPEEAPADELPKLAKSACGPNSICTVFGWRRAEDVAGALPMTDGELAALTFQYSLNRNTGFEQSLWDCRIYRRPNPDQCLSRA